MLLGLSACQTTQGLGRGTAAEKGKEPLAERLGKLLDSQCAVPISAQEDLSTHRQLRLIRAEWFLAVATRFGAARIPEYSQDTATDAALLHNQLLKTMRYLREAEAEVKRDPTLYELSRTDLVLAILRTGYFAIEPAVQNASGEIVSLIAKPSEEKVLRAAERLFQDKLYADAYRLTCTEHMSWVVRQRDAATNEAARAAALDKAIKAVKERVETHFLKQCGRVAQLADVGESCRWPETN
jgi:hypothetical protein